MLLLKIPEDGETQTGEGRANVWLHKYNKRQGSMQDVILKDEKRTDKEAMHPFLFYVAAELNKAGSSLSELPLSQSNLGQ